MRQTRKAIYAAGWSVRPLSACRISFRLVTYGSTKDSTVVEKADIDTFVITEGNTTQTAL